MEISGRWKDSYLAISSTPILTALVTIWTRELGQTLALSTLLRTIARVFAGITDATCQTFGNGLTILQIAYAGKHPHLSSAFQGADRSRERIHYLNTPSIFCQPKAAYN